MWRDLYQTDWPTPGEPDPWREMVREYRRRCDDFDDKVCTGVYKGVPVPATNDQRRLMLRNAAAAREDLLQRHKVTKAQFQTALRRYPDLD